MRERTLNRLAGAIRDTSLMVVREEVRVPQRAVVLDTDPLEVELTHSRLVLDNEDLIIAQSVRQYESDYGIEVGDGLVLLPVAGDEWVAAAVIGEQDEFIPPSGGGSGERWFTGSGTPNDATGEIGDFYLNNANGDYYEKTGATTWTLRGSLRGPQGPQGVQGPDRSDWLDRGDRLARATRKPRAAGSQGRHRIDWSDRSDWSDWPGGAGGRATGVRAGR